MNPVLKSQPRMSKHLMSKHLKSCKTIARFKQRQRRIIEDGCYGNVVPVHKETGVMAKPEMEHKCRNQDEWRTSIKIKITLKRIRVKESVEMEPEEEIEDNDQDQDYKEWLEEQFWGRM
jgi:hypothetical protein